MNLYQYAVIYVPKKKSDKEDAPKAAVVIEPTTCLAKDEKQATLLAARKIPDTYLDKLDEVEVLVRPF